MIRVEENARIDAPIDAVWSYLRDPSRIVGCIPGAALIEARDDGTYLGAMTVSFGPTRVKFQGEVALEYDDEQRSCWAKARGRDQKGLSNATGEGVFTLASDGDATLLGVTGSFNLTGPLAPFARSGGPVVVRALLAEFTTNLAAKVHSEATPASADPAVLAAVPPAGPAPVAAPESMSFWRLLLGILKQWFGRRPGASKT